MLQVRVVAGAVAAALTLLAISGCQPSSGGGQPAKQATTNDATAAGQPSATPAANSSRQSVASAADTGQPAAADDIVGCDAPPLWPGDGAAPGDRAAEYAACVKDRAYQARTLDIPLAAAVQGVIAQCQVKVDFFEHQTPDPAESGSDDERHTAELTATRVATVAVTHYRTCAGK
jgi:hypothetical protein